LSDENGETGVIIENVMKVELLNDITIV